MFSHAGRCRPITDRRCYSSGPWLSRHPHDRRGHGRSTQTATATTWIITLLISRTDRASGPEERHPRRTFHRRWRGRALPGTAWRKPGGEGRAHQFDTAADGEDCGESRRPAKGSVRRIAGATGANRSQFYRDLPTGPFYGFNRPGAKPSEEIIDLVASGHDGRSEGALCGSVAFSQTDFTEDRKKITIPVLVIHGEDNQIVLYAIRDRSPRSWLKTERSSTRAFRTACRPRMPKSSTRTCSRSLKAD